MGNRPWQTDFNENNSWTHLAIVAGIFVISLHPCLLTFNKFLSSIFKHLNPKWKGKILIVIAHPDDECMFYGPSLNQMTKHIATSDVYLLCLSNGNYYGLGKIREKELVESCSLFGIRRENVEVVDDPFLQDGDQDWDKKRVIDKIRRSVVKNKIKTIITFDAKGVSDHPNHKSIHQAICEHGNIKESKEKTIECYFLESTNIVRKYISIFDLSYSLLDCCLAMFIKKKGKFIVMGSFNDVIVTKNAMKQHRSQYVWFRKLYITFSRYIVLNTLEFKELVL